MSPGLSAVGAPGKLKALPAPPGRHGGGQLEDPDSGQEASLWPQWPPAGWDHSRGRGSHGYVFLLL